MKNKFNMLILVGILFVIIAAALIPKEEKYLRAVIAVIGAVLSLIGLVKKNRMNTN